MSLSGTAKALQSAKPGLIVSKRLSFLVCGAQKSGTTALAAYLRQHPGDSPARGERTAFLR